MKGTWTPARPRALPAIRFALAAAVALAPAVAFSGCGAQEVYVWDCQKALQRPETVPLWCGNSRITISHIRFSAWDDDSARALGRQEIQNCDPTCADGPMDVYPAQLDFARVVRCDDGKRYFSRVSLTYTGESPTGRPIETEDLTPAGVACEPV